MYVLVRYAGEDRSYILQHTDVRDFVPHDIEDYDPKKVYDIFWAGDSSTCGGYYDGKIIHMTDTEEEMEQWRKRKEARKCARKTDIPPRKKARLEEQAKGVAKKNAERELLSSRVGNSAEESKVAHLESLVRDLKAELERCKEVIGDKEKEMKNLRSLNESLQKALCAKILQNDHSQNENVSATIDKVFWEGDSATQAVNSAMHSHSLGTIAPVLPLDVASPLAAPPVAPPRADVAPPRADVAPPRADVAPPRADVTPAVPPARPMSKAPRKADQDLDLTVGTTNEAGEVHVGHGHYIDPGTWERLLTANNDSAFCKQLAVRLWGNTVLSERSVTGTLSNNAISKGATKVFPPLSPAKVASMADSFWHFLKLKGCLGEEMLKRHKRLPRYLAQKCSDLRR
ncbi:uncharacterized protein LOC144116159 [Amblyomma americanum]